MLSFQIPPLILTVVSRKLGIALRDVREDPGLFWWKFLANMTDASDRDTHPYLSPERAIRKMSYPS